MASAEKCQRGRFWADLINDGEMIRRVIALSCGCWSCPVCGPENARKLRGLIEEAVDGYLEERNKRKALLKYEIKLVTLTLPGKEWRKENTKEEAEKIIKKNLNKLLKMLRKHRGLSHYIWVKEYQQDGYAHIHLMLMGSGIASKDILDFLSGIS